MLVSEIIQKAIIPLSPDSVLENVFKEDYPDSMGYIPVVENGLFIGFLSIENLYLEKEMNKIVGQCGLEKVNEFVSPGQHIFEILATFHKSGLNMLPVLGEDSMYEGYLILENVINLVSQTLAFQSEGGILVIAVSVNDYSLSEISRLVESNQAKILSVIVESDPYSPQRLFVHLKINEKDLSRIVATLERFEYQVIEVHQTTNTISLDKERLDMLMKYLGI